jgi:hypothetical protein
MTRAAARFVSRRRLVGGGVAAAMALFRYPEPVSAGSAPEGAPRGFRSGGLDAVDALVLEHLLRRRLEGARGLELLGPVLDVGVVLALGERERAAVEGRRVHDLAGAGLAHVTVQRLPDWRANLVARAFMTPRRRDRVPPPPGRVKAPRG